MIEPKWLGMAQSWKDFAGGGYVEAFTEPHTFYITEIPDPPPGQNPYPGTKYITTCEYPQPEGDIWHFTLASQNERPKVQPIIPCFDEDYFTRSKCCNATGPQHDECWPGLLQGQKFTCCIVYSDWWVDKVIEMVPNFTYDTRKWTEFRDRHRVGNFSFFTFFKTKKVVKLSFKLSQMF